MSPRSSGKLFPKSGQRIREEIADRQRARAEEGKREKRPAQKEEFGQVVRRKRQETRGEYKKGPAGIRKVMEKEYYVGLVKVKSGPQKGLEVHRKKVNYNIYYVDRRTGMRLVFDKYEYRDKYVDKRGKTQIRVSHWYSPDTDRRIIESIENGKLAQLENPDTEKGGKLYRASQTVADRLGEDFQTRYDKNKAWARDYRDWVVSGRQGEEPEFESPEVDEREVEAVGSYPSYVR